ncbi:helix-turn-helix domain-containing protein [Sphingomonas oryzagri]|uniref:Helix-turn-helix domain-containing protein n=1 Tax=Sphingomonas oryzagri TaxID=3042314 RepID=A0ABT6N6G0_9SPHN|nr:helix-turn-helix domain-containing protein [Sphingomonas oryzagri]MDH7640683.1 helix-turn-helix domain-containing protein [Sphingomonas oryzagri]
MDRGVQQIVTPQGDVLVVMPLAHFERLSAAAGMFIFSDERDAEAVPAEVRVAIDEGESPLAAWRRYRAISQSALARESGVSRFTIMRIEAAGAGAGNRQSRKLLAAALDIPVSAI